MERMKTGDARDEFGAVVNRVAYGNEWIVLERRGKEMAALIPMRDLRLLERLIEEEEDRMDLASARKSMAEPGENVPLKQVMEELGIRDEKDRTSAKRPERAPKAARG